MNLSTKATKARKATKTKKVTKTKKATTTPTASALRTGPDALVSTIIHNRLGRIRPHTIQGDNILLKHLEEYGCKDIAVTSIDAEFCKKFAHHLLYDKHLRVSSVKLYLQKLHAVLQDAIYAGILSCNPMPPISRLVPKCISAERESLTVDEINRLQKTKCRHLITQLAFLFSVFTGLRLSDIETLRWENIMPSNGRHLLKKIQVKTDNEVCVPLCDSALKILNQIKSSHLDKDGLIFPLYSRPTTAKDLNQWAKDAGIERHITFHVSRISFVSLALSANINIVIISKLCGHKNVKTTQIYARMVDSTFAEAIDCLQDLFIRKRPALQRPDPRWNCFNIML